MKCAVESLKTQRSSNACDAMRLRGVWATQSQCVDCWLAGVWSWLLTTSVPVSWPPIPTNFTRYRRHFAVTTFSLSCLALEHNYLVAFSQSNYLQCCHPIVQQVSSHKSQIKTILPDSIFRQYFHAGVEKIQMQLINKTFSPVVSMNPS